MFSLPQSSDTASSDVLLYYLWPVCLCCLSERVHDVYRCDVCLDVYRCDVCLCRLSERDDDVGGVTCACVAFHDA